VQVLEVGTQIQEKVKTRLDQNQREYVLREQLQVIRQELGEGEGDDELEELAGGSTRQLSAEAKKVADASSNACARCHRNRPSIRLHVPISTSSPRCPGAASRRPARPQDGARDPRSRPLRSQTIKERILEYLACGR